jgi:hypothetical protein
MDAAAATVMKRLDRYSPSGRSDPTVPILKAFMEHLPVDGISNLVEDLKSFESDAQIKQHADSLRTCLLIPMKANKNIADKFDQSAVREGRMKTECLERDNYKCTVTRRIEVSYLDKNDITTPAATTECAHIIPFSLGKWESKAEEAKTAIWVTINRCFPNLSRDLNFTHESVNDNRNGMTMQKEYHTYFGQFEISFEATATPNTYRVMNHAPNIIPLSLPPQVRFVCHDGRYELPSPELLKTHAAIARILDASEQGWDIDNILRHQDATRVLAKDGSTDISAFLSATSLSALSSARTDP